MVLHCIKQLCGARAHPCVNAGIGNLKTLVRSITPRLTLPQLLASKARSFGKEPMKTPAVGIAVLFVFSSLLAGCVTTARLYNLDTGEVLNAKFQNNGTGHGTITARTASGQTLTGEYSTISGMSYSSGFGSATVSGGGGFAWATAQGFAFNMPGKQYGTATVVGNGLVIEVVYEVDPWTSHGTGVGRDNKGGRYRLQF